MKDNGRENEPVSHLIPRPRLTDLLDRASAPIVALVAPAGYGKTTLAREWTGTADRRSVWYRASPASADIAAIAVGLAALSPGREARDRLRRRLSTSSNAEADLGVLIEMLTEAFAEWPRDQWLVIDDYHYLTPSKATESLIGALAIEGRLRLLVASRIRPYWVTARRLLYGEVFELSKTGLAMTHEEAAAVLAVSGDDATTSALVALADGWPAVIGLAARRERSSAGLDDLGPETLYGFFADELLQTLSPTAQLRLPMMAIAPRMPDGLLESILGPSANETVVEALDAGFLRPIDDGYEMHPLLRDFLLAKGAAPEPLAHDEFAEKLTRWYLDNGYVDEAFLVANHARSVSLMELVILLSMDDFLATGRLATLEAWLGAARNAGATGPIVKLSEAELLFRCGKWKEAGVLAGEIAADPKAEQRLLSRALYRAGQSAQLDDRGDEAVQLLERAETVSGSRVERRKILWSKFIAQVEIERLGDAEVTLHRFAEERSDSLEDELQLAQARLRLALANGGVDDALRRAELARSWVRGSLDPIVHTGFLQTLAYALALTARYEEAIEVSDEELQEASKARLDFVHRHAICTRAVAHLGQRAFELALRDVELAFELALEADDLHCQMNSLAISARIHLAQHNPTRALQVITMEWPRPPSPAMMGELLATRSLVEAVAGDYRKVKETVLDAQQASVHCEGRALRSLALAVAAHRQGNADSTPLLDLALQETVTSGNYDAFVCTYRSYPQILEDFPSDRSVHAIAATRVLCRVDPLIAEKLKFKPVGPRGRSTSLLTPREQEVLGLLRQGMSNRQIAATLWISEPTAKVHVRHILKKLGARSRTEAAMSDAPT